MNTLRPLTTGQLRGAEHSLLQPAPGSRIEAAANYDLDLSLLAEQLRLTPTERARKLESGAAALEKVRGFARRRS